ncbi:hypothetical protein Q5752_004994 [Cryptotrichosporon argae]
MSDRRRSRLSNLMSRTTPAGLSSRSESSSYLSPNPSAARYPTRSASPASSLDHGTSASHAQPVEVRYDDELLPPTVPFGGPGGSNSSSRRSSFSSLTDLKNAAGARPASLSVNYVPAKFTKLHTPGDYAHRRKQGGGRDAFAANAQRMGQPGTVDDDEGLVFQLGKGGLKAKHKPKLRWNRFKWILFVANTLLIIYGLATLISAILVWLNVFYQSDVIRVGNRSELIISTVAAALMVLTSLIGYSGILLNNRAFLAVYTLLLWFCLALLVTPGYMTYKQRTFNLEGKINAQWSRDLGTNGRLRIQDALRCCGYFSPYVEATVSALCYPRSNEAGCKNQYLKVERNVLETWYAIAFALVPAHIGIIIASLLCSNHITYRFGKGLTPKRYRLDLSSMAVIMDEYASQIAAQYGPQVAEAAVSRSSMLLDEGSLASRTSAVAGGPSRGLTRPTSRLVPGKSEQSTPSAYAYASPFDEGTGLGVQPPVDRDHRRSSSNAESPDDSLNFAGRGAGAGTTASRYGDTLTPPASAVGVDRWAEHERHDEYDSHAR